MNKATLPACKITHHQPGPVDHDNIQATMPLRIITLNVRYAIKKKLLPNEAPWEARCPKLAAQLRFHTAGLSNIFICIQEAQHQQLLDLQAELGQQWSHIGQGRANGDTDGEFSPIFYRSNYWVLEHTKTQWLSPTPDVPSAAWGAAINRIVTTGLFRRKASATRVVVMSTHLDHQSRRARAESAKLLLDLSKNWQRTFTDQHHNSMPVFLGGDFNSGPDDEPYRILTTGSESMLDIKYLVPEPGRHGHTITYTTFGEAEPTTIDYLFVLQPKGIKFLNFAVLSNRFDDGFYYSDHRPVVADVELSVVNS